MKRLLTLLTAMLGTLISLTAAVVERPLEYKAGDVLCEGWHAYDDATTSRRPGLLIIHQWTGAGHSFTHKAAGNDNSKGAAYNAKADRDSWFPMEQFLKAALGR
ncbi:MAG: hypothetical protein ACKOY8_05945 [Verrucomicrobiota bacterium]